MNGWDVGELDQLVAATEKERAARDQVDVDQVIVDLASARRRRGLPEVRRVGKPLRVRQMPLEEPARSWSIGFAIGVLLGRLLRASVRARPHVEVGRR